MGKEFNKRCYGITIIRSENSNWNADFSGTPRMLPDDNGTIYATDKALKYAMRKYWNDTGKDVFVWKTFKENQSVNILEERYKNMKSKLNAKDHFDLLSKCIDVKLFGITLAVEKITLSLTGPAQISYGVDKFNINRVYSNSILSPFANSSSKDESKASTLGNEIKNLKSYYVYDFVVNPRNSTDHYDDVAKLMKLNEDDIESFKDALNKGATNLNTASKIGSENVLTLFITLKEGTKTQIRALKNLITIKGDDTIIFKEINELLSKYPEIESIELFKSDPKCKVENIENWIITDVIK